MKLKTELAGHTHELKIERAGSKVAATIDGVLYDLEVRPSNPGEFLFVENTRVYECRVNRRAGQQEMFDVSVGPDNYEIKLIDLKRLRAQSSGAHDHGTAEIIAPMPGRVVRVLVEVGTSVEAGAGIVVVEAMKMQNEMKAPKAGTVVALNAEAGVTVNAGDVLAVVE